ncbi:nucleotidyltransferase family protein [Massilia sp. ZL223]|nr:nucleotidyltransferase family protein [Massilia sp. ZL223]
MLMARPLLVTVLAEPARLHGLAPAQWDLLLRQSAACGLHASLYHLALGQDALAGMPERARRHLEWADLRWRAHGRAAQHEVACILEALSGIGVAPVLLKGAAYAAAGLQAALGRRYADIDILVPKERLPDVEAALMLHGWRTTALDPYDQRYYREWMHELPPMSHAQRGNTVDVHHAIVPETAAARPDPAKLRAAAVPVPGQPGLWTLCPHDMFLHSAVHLFWDGEFEHGLRDLFDLHRLALQFGPQPGFWDGLAARARELDLARPLFYALRYCVRLLGTAVPTAVLAEAEAGPGRPKAALLALMDALFLRVLPPHLGSAGPARRLAHGALYVRGNWLRMPPLLLSRHLFHKAFLSPRLAEAG